MASVNKVILVGQLGRDPEARATTTGHKVCNFSMATSEKYKNRDGEQVEKTEWHRVVMWRGLADIGEKYLRKGSLVYIEGKLQTRSWENNEGQTQYTTEIVADQMQMLGKRSENNEEQNQQQQSHGELNW